MAQEVPVRPAAPKPAPLQVKNTAQKRELKAAASRITSLCPHNGKQRWDPVLGWQAKEGKENKNPTRERLRSHQLQPPVLKAQQRVICRQVPEWRRRRVMEGAHKGL
eukprot:112000-Chlamydomonas_euryale.AAC.1